MVGENGSDLEVMLCGDVETAHSLSKLRPFNKVFRN